jgi:hypothetical protein
MMMLQLERARCQLSYDPRMNVFEQREGPYPFAMALDAFRESREVEYRYVRNAGGLMVRSFDDVVSDLELGSTALAVQPWSL